MTTSWDSLYLPSNSQAEVVAVLQEIMTALGYTRYDPFGGIPGKVYQQVLRLFVAPAHEGWVRILGRPDPRMLGALSQSMCLYLRLEGDTALIETYTSGYPRDALESLAPYRRDEIEALRRALYEDVAEAAPQETVQTGQFAAGRRPGHGLQGQSEAGSKADRPRQPQPAG